MRIGFFIPELYVAGAERITVNLCNELSSSHDVFLYVLDNGGKLQREINNEVNVVELRRNHVLTAGYELAKQVQKDELELLHCSLPNSSLTGLVADRLTDMPITLAIHNSPQRRNDLKSKVMYSLFDLLYNDNLVKTPSEGTTEEVKRYFGIKNVETIGNPVVDSINEAETERDIDFLFVGRLHPQKNLSNLLEAAKKLDNNFRIVICGEGRKREELEKKAPSNVEFEGFVQNPSKYMQRSKVFVLPSNYEALSTVSIEALSCGCQLVGTDCNGMNEIAGDLSYIVPKDSSGELAEAMLEAIKDPVDQSSLRERSKKFEVEKKCKDHLEVFRDQVRK